MVTQKHQTPLTLETFFAELERAQTLKEITASAKRLGLFRALLLSHGNRTLATKRLGITKPHFFRLMLQFPDIANHFKIDG